MALKNRVVQYPNRYMLRDEAGNETGPFYLVRAEGEVEEAGTPLNAENISAEIKEQIESELSPFTIDNNGNVSVKNIQKGRASIKGKAKTVVSKEITFPHAFDKIPTVVVTPGTKLPQSVHAAVYDVTTKGFMLHLYRDTNATNTVHWIAMI